MPVTAWRIGFTSVKCDRCGRVEESHVRPDGYTALLRSGWTEVPHRAAGFSIRQLIGLRGPRGPHGRPQLPDLLCPECAAQS